MVDNTCANIFSKTHYMLDFYIIEIYFVWSSLIVPGSACMHLFLGYIVSSLYILKERIFVFMCILNFFLARLCVFLFFPHLLKFSPKIVLFFLFSQGEKAF